MNLSHTDVKGKTALLLEQQYCGTKHSVLNALFFSSLSKQNQEHPKAYPQTAVNMTKMNSVEISQSTKLLKLLKLLQYSL